MAATNHTARAFNRDKPVRAIASGKPRAPAPAPLPIFLLLNAPNQDQSLKGATNPCVFSTPCCGSAISIPR